METKNFDFFAYLKRKAEKVEKVLTEFFPQPKGYGGRVVEAASYSLSAGGKRIRPVLCLASCEVVGGRDEDVLFFAAGIECIHTYSLIHDDLPAMDDDDFRRGKPSCHKAYDEATAILAGDGLQSLAFWFFTHPEQVKRVSKSALLKAIHLISQAIGFEGMVGGQMADLLMEGKKAGLKILKWIHLHKTVKLIEASVLAGALLAKAKKKELQALKSYAKHLGMAFQIVDDLLDVIGDEKKLGKKTLSDVKKQKLTYPSVLGLEKTRELAEIHTQKAISALEPFGEKAIPLRAMAEFVLKRVY